jgi:hypothetical protein
MLSAVRHDAIPMHWVYDALNLNGEAEEYLHLTPGGYSFKAMHRDLVTGVMKLINPALFAKILADVKALATGKLPFTLIQLLLSF